MDTVSIFNQGKSSIHLQANLDPFTLVQALPITIY